MHSRGLSMGGCCPWGDAVHGGDAVTWGDAVHGGILFMGGSCPCTVFNVAQEIGLSTLKLLKCATTRLLSHGEVSQRLDTIYFQKQNGEVKGVCKLLLKPDTVLFLLLFSDVMKHVNHFSRFL